MAIILYQIGIFVAIYIASFFGKKSRNTAVILISIFTLLQVFMSWLLILQFLTILIAYSFTENRSIQTNSNSYGIVPNNPILLKDNLTSYRYINTLSTFGSNLTYKKTQSIKLPQFDNPIDVYEFKKSGVFYCNIYIYPYSAENNLDQIPEPFQKN